MCLDAKILWLSFICVQFRYSISAIDIIVLISEGVGWSPSAFCFFSSQIELLGVSNHICTDNLVKIYISRNLNYPIII